MLNILVVLVGIAFGFVIYALANFAVKQILRVDDYDYLMTLSEKSFTKRLSTLVRLSYAAVFIAIIAGAISINVLTNIIN